MLPLKAGGDRVATPSSWNTDVPLSKTLDGIITSWNPGAEKIFGYSAGEAIDKPMLMLIPPDRIDEESDILGRISRGERVPPFETLRLKKDGTEVSISTTFSPIRNGRGEIVDTAPRIVPKSARCWHPR